MKNKKKITKAPVSCACLMSRMRVVTLTAIQDLEVPATQTPPEEDHEEPKGTGFLDLSAELRNVIYELCLTISESICICIDRQTPPSIEPSRWRGRSITKTFNPTHRCYQTAYHAIALSPNLLVACKTINEEATSVLYGSNSFVLHPDNLRSKTKKRPWVEVIDNSVKHLRKVELHSASNQRTIVRILKALQQAENLQVLTVSFWANFWTDNTMAAALFPLVRELHQARKDTAQPAAMDVCQWEPVVYAGVECFGMAGVKSILERRLIAIE